jgi:thymidylate synthase
MDIHTVQMSTFQSGGKIVQIGILQAGKPIMKKLLPIPKRVWNFSAVGVNDYYVDICKKLIEQGTETSPRGKLTKELHPTTVIIQEPRKRLMTCHGRMINLPFALVEAIQIITGQNDAQALAFYNSGIISIQGDGPRGTPHWELDVFRFNAAYGERLRHFDLTSVTVDQLEHVIETLKRDPDSRQASIVLSHPLYDNYTVETNDRACNVYAHAMIRDGKLDWMQIIRSNDAIWGIPYNMVQWSHLQEWVATTLGVEVGTLFIVQDSFHVYADKYDECNNIKEFDLYMYIDTLPMMAGDGIANHLLTVERNIRTGMEYGPDDLKRLDYVIGPYWSSVIAALQSYRAFKRGRDDLALDLLPEYMEIRAPMLRNYSQWRWSKLRTFGNLLQIASLELSGIGIPHEEVAQWLGIEPVRS